MTKYVTGIVKAHQGEAIILEIYNKDHFVHGVRLEKLPVKALVSLYLYCYQKQFTKEYFGFLTVATKNYFLELTSIYKIGPKTALKLLNLIAVDEFVLAIKNREHHVLQRCKGITRQLADVIINHFQQRLPLYNNNDNYEQKWRIVFDTLINAGFGKNAINHCLTKSNWKLADEQIIRDAVITLEANYY